jgi:hypothetical protein
LRWRIASRISSDPRRSRTKGNQGSHSFLEASRLFEFDIDWATRWDDFMSYFLTNPPNIVHIAVHSKEDGAPVFLNPLGRAHPISPALISAFLVNHRNSIQLVFLNTSHSSPTFDALAKDIDNVVLVEGAVGDRLARQFATSFYHALAETKSVTTAFDFAQMSAQGRTGTVATQFKLFTRMSNLSLVG